MTFLLTALVVSQFKKYLRLKSGKYVKGVVRNVERVEAVGEDEGYDKTVVEFSLKGVSVVSIEAKFSSLDEVTAGEEVNVWVDEQNAARSVVLPKCDYFWWLGLGVWCIITAVMYAVDGYIIWKYFLNGAESG